MTLIQAQQQYIDKVRDCSKNTAAGARLSFFKWAKKHGYDPVVVQHDALDVLELERIAREHS